MRRKANFPATCLATILALTATAAAAGGPATAAEAGADHRHAHDHHGSHQPAASAAAPAAEGVAVKLSDAPLIDHNGSRVRLKSDVVGDRVVVMSFVYTTCTTVCPVVSAIFSRVQDKLGARLGTEVRLVSVSVDPLRDTPARLKTYAAQHGAKPGWSWLTGAATNVTEVLKGLGAYSSNFEEHPVFILVGDGKTGKWSRMYGFTDPEQVLARVDEFIAARGQANTKAAHKE